MATKTRKQYTAAEKLWLEGYLTESYQFIVESVKQAEVSNSEDSSDSQQGALIACRMGLKQMRTGEIIGLKKGDQVELSLKFPLNIDLWLTDYRLAKGKLVNIADQLGTQITAIS